MMKKLLFFLVFSAISQLIYAGSWNQKSSLGGVGRHRSCGLSIANKGYIGTGHVNGTGVDISYKDWWEFDPASNSWTQKADFPAFTHGAVTFSTDTKGYVGGGSGLGGEFYAYDPTTNLWTGIPLCPLLVSDSQGFGVQNKGYVYLSNQLAEFDPALNSWSMKPNAPISFGTWSCSFGNNSSGFIKSGGLFYEFKPSQNIWVQRASFPGVMSNGSSAFSIYDKGYVTCGYVGGLSTVTDEVWEFNPGNNVWTRVQDFPGTKRRFPVAFAIHNVGYFGTGTNGINFNDFWEYDPLKAASGLDELAMNSVEMTLYPNPALNNLSIELNGISEDIFEELSVKIFSSDGREVYADKVVGLITQVNRTELPKGIYFVTLNHQGKKIESKKLILL